MQHQIRVLVLLASFSTGALGWGQGLSGSAAVQKAEQVLLAMSLRHESVPLTAEPFSSKDDDGTVLRSGWKVQCPERNIRLMLAEDGQLISFFRADRRSGATQPPISLPTLWQNGEKVIRAIGDYNGELKRGEAKEFERTGSSVQSTVSKHARLTWLVGDFTYPRSGTIEITFDEFSGEIVQYARRSARSYGPTTPVLTAADAIARRKEHIAQLRVNNAYSTTLVDRAEEKFEGAQPTLVWSEGGGARGFPDARKYFIRGEYRLSYAWECGLGMIEIDANTGELLAADFNLAKSEADAGQVGGGSANAEPDAAGLSSRPNVTMSAAVGGGALLLLLAAAKLFKR